jgi:hypothetical protein
MPIDWYLKVEPLRLGLKMNGIHRGTLDYKEDIELDGRSTLKRKLRMLATYSVRSLLNAAREDGFGT